MVDFATKCANSRNMWSCSIAANGKMAINGIWTTDF